MDKVSIEECRQILGRSSEGVTDAEIESLRDDLERTADVLLDQMQQEIGEHGMDRINWAVYFQQTGEGE